MYFVFFLFFFFHISFVLSSFFIFFLLCLKFILYQPAYFVFIYFFTMASYFFLYFLLAVCSFAFTLLTFIFPDATLIFPRLLHYFKSLSPLTILQLSSGATSVNFAWRDAFKPTKSINFNSALRITIPIWLDNSPCHQKALLRRQKKLRGDRTHSCFLRGLNRWHLSVKFDIT